MQCYLQPFLSTLRTAAYRYDETRAICRGVFHARFFAERKGKKEGGGRKRKETENVSLYKGASLFSPPPVVLLPTNFPIRPVHYVFFHCVFGLAGVSRATAGKFIVLFNREPFNAGNLSTMMILFARR